MGWPTKDLFSIYSREKGFSPPSLKKTGDLFKNGRAHLNGVKRLGLGAVH